MTSNSTAESVYSNISSGFKNDAIREIMKTQFVNTKMKITEDVLTLINEISRAIVVEAAIRAAKQATLAGKKTVELEHVETVLPQMILDLP